MKIRQTIITVNEYEAVHYTADMVTGWAYVSTLWHFGRSEPTLFPKRENETIEEAYKRVRAETNCFSRRDLKKYYKHITGDVVINPKHKVFYYFKDGKVEAFRKNMLKELGYEIIEEETE